MEPFNTLDAIVVPLDRANVDTDAVIPKQLMKSIRRTGFGDKLFDEWRYLDRGGPGQDASHRPRNPEFALNQPAYAGAQILLARENFGCGSSREHAPWALHGYGIRALVAPRLCRHRLLATASRTACCPSCWTRPPWTGCLHAWPRNPACAGPSTCPRRR